MKLGINWNERETRLSAVVIVASAAALFFPQYAANIRETAVWGAGLVGLLTHTSE